MVSLFCYPIFSVYFSWSEFSFEIWSHLINTTLGETVARTGLLVLTVVPLTLFVGTTLALLCREKDVPPILLILLVLPLAVPKYVMAFVYLTLFDFAGPLQSSLREYGIDLSVYLQTGQLGPTAFVFTLSLYPYVFLSAREGLKTVDRNIIEAAQIAGAKKAELYRSFFFPQLRPWLLAGSTLVAMECLSDFGAVAIFNYDTFTTTIYKSWFGLFSFSTAAQLSSLLTLLSLAILYLLKMSKKDVNIYESTTVVTGQLTPQRTALCNVFCAIVITFAVLIPVSQMLIMARETQITLHNIGELVANTFLIACFTGITTLLLVFILRLFDFVEPRFKSVRLLPSVGYSIPGIILAIGLLLMMEQINVTSVLRGTICLTVLGLSLKFFAVASENIEAGFQRVPASQRDAAVIAGANILQQCKDIFAPYLKKSIVIAFLLVFVDAAKEMPIMLMTRTFGFDTLSVKIFEFTAEGRYAEAVLPAAFLAIIGIIPLIIFHKKLV